jgi:DNA-binding CsgD family transcriptional regulator
MTYDPELIEKVRALGREGLSSAEIARKLGESYTVVVRIRKRGRFPGRSEAAAAARQAKSDAEAEVLRLTKEGLSPRALCLRLGLSKSWVYRRLLKLRRAGKLPPRERPASAYEQGRRLGYVRDVLQMLDQEQRTWLLEQVPAGASIAETLAMFVRDACDEEQERKK